MARIVIGQDDIHKAIVHDFASLWSTGNKMELDKMVPDTNELETLRKERDSLSSDVYELNSNLRSLVGSVNSTIDLIALQQTKDDLTDCNKSDTKNPRDRVSSTNDGDKKSPERDGGSPKTETKAQVVKLSSVLVQPEFRKQGLELEERRRAALELQRNDKQFLDRNKRMFGMLMGTLQQFRTEENGREKSTIKRFKVEEKLDSAVEKERAMVNEEVDKIVKLKREKEELLERANRKLDIIERYKNWEKTHRHLLGGFIRTETKPKLLWSPKEHTAESEKKLKETRDYFGLCVAERTAKFKKELEELNK